MLHAHTENSLIDLSIKSVLSYIIKISSILNSFIFKGCPERSADQILKQSSSTCSVLAVVSAVAGIHLCWCIHSAATAVRLRQGLHARWRGKETAVLPVHGNQPSKMYHYSSTNGTVLLRASFKRVSIYTALNNPVDSVNGDLGEPFLCVLCPYFSTNWNWVMSLNTEITK